MKDDEREFADSSGETGSRSTPIRPTEPRKNPTELGKKTPGKKTSPNAIGRVSLLPETSKPSQRDDVLGLSVSPKSIASNSDSSESSPNLDKREDTIPLAAPLPATNADGNQVDGNQVEGNLERSAEGSSSDDAISDDDPNDSKGSHLKHQYPDKQATVISSKPPIYSPLDAALAPVELGQTLVGRNLAHFELQEYVGGGGMGAVFRARDSMLERIVAVKVLSRDHGNDEDTVRRFRNEAQSAARLDHENIARVYFVGEEDGWYFIVFEYIEGTNIRDLVEMNGQLEVSLAFQLTLQIAEALEHASNRDVVHRDIKPSNVLLTQHGRAKLVDMGLARLHQVRPDQDDLTASGVTLGTFDYISPEQARDPRMADVRSDIYSLGCTLFFMLTGQPPFPKGTVLQKLLSHSSETPPDPAQWRDDVPRQLSVVLQRMLAKKPEARYQRPSELIGDLILVGERLGWQATTRGEPIFIASKQPAVRWAERHLPWIIPIALFFIFMVFLDPLWLSNQTSATNVPIYNVPESVEPRDSISRVIAETPENQNRATRQETSTLVRRPDEIGLGDTSDFQRARNRTDQLERPVDLENEFDVVNDDRSSEDSEWRADSRARDDGPLDRNSSGSDADTDVESSERANLDNGENGELFDRRNDQETLDNRTGFPRIRDPLAVDANSRIIVSRSGSTEDRVRVFDSLKSAVSYAKSRAAIETIELRFDDVMNVGQIQLPNRDLAIVAGKGYSPKIRLGIESGLSPESPASFIQCTASPLSMTGVHLELKVPDNTINDRWSVFELASKCDLKLRSCTITVRNSQGDRNSHLDNVAVFRLDEGRLSGADDTRQPVSRIAINDCAIRGEATLLRALPLANVELNWVNGLLVTTERLAWVSPHSSQLSNDYSIRIQLEHVTAIVDQGLFEFSSVNKLAEFPKTDIVAHDCIFVTRRYSLIHVLEATGGVLTKFNFEGRDNFYQDIGAYLQISAGGFMPINSVGFRQWQRDQSEQRPREDAVMWARTVSDNKPVHKHVIRDYRLSPKIENDAVGSSIDGTDAGFQVDQVPDFPVPVVPEYAIPF